jgi:hypothetical protein
MAVDLFSRLAKGRQQRQPKTGNAELTRDLERLHSWLQHTDKTTISLRDLCYCGPNSLRKRARVIHLAEILAGRGLLIPNRTRRHDQRVWEIVRGAAHPTPPQSDSMTVARRNRGCRTFDK